MGPEVRGGEATEEPKICRVACAEAEFSSERRSCSLKRAVGSCCALVVVVVVYSPPPAPDPPELDAAEDWELCSRSLSLRLAEGPPPNAPENPVLRSRPSLAALRVLCCCCCCCCWPAAPAAPEDDDGELQIVLSSPGAPAPLEEVTG